MESGKFPTIRFDLTGVVPGAQRGDTVAATLLGTFHIHGVSREASIPATVVLLPHAVQVRGETPLDLTSYRIGGLSKALGMLRMLEHILVRVDLTFVTAAGEEPAVTSVRESPCTRRGRSLPPSAQVS